MSRKRWFGILLILIAILSNVVLLTRETKLSDPFCELHYTLLADTAGNYQLFYSNRMDFSEENSIRVPYNNATEIQELVFSIPVNTNYIRFDINECVTQASISNLYIQYKNKKIEIPLSDLVMPEQTQMIESLEQRETTVWINTNGNDAFLVLNLQKYEVKEIVEQSIKMRTLFQNGLMCFLIDLVLCCFYRYVESIKRRIEVIYQNRELIVRLSKNDFKVKYAGSYFGIIWAFVQPIVTILIYWFVFQMGFRSQAVENVPFVLWLIAGLIPWFYFSEAISNGSNSLIEYSYLVKKVVFNVSVLPIVKVISALFVHLFFLVAMIFIFVAYGYIPDFYTLQLFYYLFCMFVLALGLSYLGSSLMVFFRDMGQMINILLQIGMWITPIMWQSDLVSEKFRIALKLNPIYYIILGYRNSLISKEAFWKDMPWTVYFWIITTILLFLGAKLFHRLKPHFADVL